MPITLPESYRQRLEPFAREAGATVDELAVQALEYWLSWREAEPALAKALDDRPPEPWTTDDVEAAKQRVRDKHPDAFRE
jgi:hypothetical protein